jgi:threonine dehydrogenase-like Zn-dependent dehydrogenase
MVRRMSPGTSLVVLLAGAGFVGYLAWIFARARK